MTLQRQATWIPAAALLALLLAGALAGCPRQAEGPVGEPAAPAAQAPAKAPDPATTTAPAPAVAKPPPGGPIYVRNVGLATPESVLHDPERDLYLVANINGSPLQADGNGFISTVSPEGKVVALRWIDGAKQGVTLNAPKGMALSGELLYVADITHVRAFDRKTGAPRASIAIPGGTFVNDLVAAPDGTIFASDSGEQSAAVWSIAGKDARPVALIKGKDLGRPNGLTLDGDKLVVVTMASGEIYHLGRDGKRGQSIKAPRASLDGVERLDDGSLLVSSWEAQAVYRVDRSGAFTTLVDGVESPADIGLDRKRRRVLIPLFKRDQLLFLPL